MMSKIRFSDLAGPNVKYRISEMLEIFLYCLICERIIGIKTLKTTLNKRRSSPLLAAVSCRQHVK